MSLKQRWYQRHQLFNQNVPADLLPWLFDSSSLTSRLIARCGDNFNVHVISQRWQKIDSSEAAAMGLVNEHSALVRQVLLRCGDTPVVYARTVIPAVTIKGAQRRYANMGNRPLGAMLFADRTMQREIVHVARLSEAHGVNQFYAANENAEKDVWGRRSVFRVAQKPLLVSEFFLPALTALD